MRAILRRLRPKPIFGGYGFVAAASVWLLGIAIRTETPLSSLPVWFWMAAGGISASVWLGSWLAHRRLLGNRGGVIGRVLLIAGLLCAWFAFGAARAASADSSDSRNAISHLLPNATHRLYRIRGTIAAEPLLGEGYQDLTIEASAESHDGGRSWRPVVGRVEASVRSLDDWSAPAYGDAVTVTGTLAPLGSGYAPPGVLARLQRAKLLNKSAGNPIFGWLFALRLTLAQAIQRTVPEPEAALLIGILLGMKTPALRARLPLFTATGTIHLVVPAGLKVATLAEFSKLAVARLGVLARTGAALFVVVAYAALGGGGPAAVRAALMGGLLALAPALRRGYNVFTALALAAVVLSFIEPLVILDAGFQLTMLATLGLPLLTAPIQRRLALLLGRLPAGASIAELLAVTLSAQIATLPVLALTFQQVSLVAPLANLLTVPLLAPLLVLGGVVAMLAAVGGVAGVVAMVLTWIVWPLLWFSNTAILICAALPFAALSTPGISTAFALGYFVAAGGILWVALRLRRSGSGAAARNQSSHVPPNAGEHSGHVRLSRAALASVVLLAVLGACGASAPPLLDRQAHVDFLAVGPGGESALVRLPSGVTVLIDGGAAGPVLEAQLAGKLPFWRRQLDVAVLTDPRPGDANGLLDVATHFAVAHAIDSGLLHPTTEYLAWDTAMRRAGASRAHVREGDVIHLDAASSIRVLAPPAELYPAEGGATVASNDAILRLELPGLRVLFLGAADDYALDALAGANQPLQADVVEVALPPNAPVTLDGPLGTILARAHPRLIVVTSAPLSSNATKARLAADANYEALDAETAAQLGALLYRTDVAGTISLSGDIAGWTLG